MKEEIIYHFRQLKQQLNDQYKLGSLDTVSHNSILMTVNTLEYLIKEDKQIYPCEHIIRDIANCKWKECVKLDCPINKNNKENR